MASPGPGTHSRLVWSGGEGPGSGVSCGLSCIRAHLHRKLPPVPPSMDLPAPFHTRGARVPPANARKKKNAKLAHLLTSTAQEDKARRYSGKKSIS